MKRALGWQRIDTPGVEYAEVAFNPLVIAGHLVCVDGGALAAVQYEVVCDDAGQTLRASLRRDSDGETDRLEVSRGANGVWMVNGSVVPAVAGVLDIDIALTPSTNVLPLRRLALSVGEAADVTAAWVRFPAFDIVPLRQRYRRTGARTYEYTSLEHGFAADLTVDEGGMVIDYGAIWRRLVP